MLLSFVRILEPTFVVRSQAVLFKMGEGMGDVSEIQKRITQMRLWEFPDKYVFEPTDSLATQFLSIDRSSGDLNSISQLPDSNASHSQIVFGLVGVFRPVAGKSQCHMQRAFTGVLDGFNITMNFAELCCWSESQTLGNHSG